ncbi:unnamed protein product [Blepharisma stoltei]|uniref:Uncharacterized protein n=1 Tax=Blepharisma stoltei TaxID=1481888 RepID=A0AAU9JH35_9CILI|nr:unnamed protein product [Blepharisma stoltei]
MSQTVKHSHIKNYYKIKPRMQLCFTPSNNRAVVSSASNQSNAINTESHQTISSFAKLAKNENTMIFERNEDVMKRIYLNHKIHKKPLELLPKKINYRLLTIEKPLLNRTKIQDTFDLNLSQKNELKKRCRSTSQEKRNSLKYSLLTPLRKNRLEVL